MRARPRSCGLPTECRAHVGPGGFGLAQSWKRVVAIQFDPNSDCALNGQRCTTGSEVRAQIVKNLG